MFPLKDTVRTRSFPIINFALISLNILVYVHEFVIGPRQMDRFILRYGLTPVRFYWGLHHNLIEAIVPIFTSMFLHGGLFHVLGNMWFLYIFGDSVEDRTGHVPYLVFYLLCGVAAALTQMVVMPTSTVPVVGASGAIAGVLGGYFVLYPRARVLTLIPIFIFIQLVEVPAVIFLLVWFAMQFIQGALTPANQAGGVAWWAHIGGFVAGIVLILLFRKRENTRASFFES